MRLRSAVRALVFGGAVLGGSVWAASPQALAAAGADGPTLLTPGQKRVDDAALVLLTDPQVQAAREAVVKAWSALPPATLADGQAQLEGAVDELVYSAVRSVAERSIAGPTITWSIAPPYAYGAVKVPGSRFGIDSVDRIYRVASLNPATQYVLHGQRNPKSSNDDFLFEAADAHLASIASLGAKDIDVAPDGSFTITIDASPANGRRNHLTLPPSTVGLLIRDTLADWNNQIPNRLSLTATGGAPVTPTSPEVTRYIATAAIGGYATVTGQLLDTLWKQPVNQLAVSVRPLSSGVEGAIIGFNRFSIKGDEALVVQIDPQGAGYFGVTLGDPWTRSLSGWNATTSLSKAQSKLSADGSVTFIVSAKDPGYANWLSTTGLNDGILALRVEKFTHVDAAKVVRSVRLVKLADLARNLPADAVKVSAAQRAQELRLRAEGYQLRLTQ